MGSIFSALFLLLIFATGAAACPTYNYRGAEYNIWGEDIDGSSSSFSLTAGGDYYIEGCPNVQPITDRGPGYFYAQPHFTFYLDNMEIHTLDIRVYSDCDATLLINTATEEWYYDDDDNGNLDPRIFLTRPANGRLDVWVGTYDGSTCGAELVLATYAR